MKSNNFKKFLLIWLGELISSIGGGLTTFGLGVYVFSQTGNATSMVLVTLLGFLPSLILSVPAGVLADKYDRRLLMIIGDGCSGLGIVYILICMLNGGATLLQICIGVFISSVFSSLLEPSFKATITDLLTKEEFSKASGLVSLAGSSKYLFSPIIAGFLLSISSINLLLIIDICTFIFTIIVTAMVRKNIKTKQVKSMDSLFKGFKEGWNAIYSNKGIFMLILVSALITMFMGILQVLIEPMVLSFTDSKTLGIAETVCASGMLVSSIFLGIYGIKKKYVKILSIALALSGISMIGMGILENIVMICFFGMFFFFTLPFANNCLDYLVRTNIPDELQGRSWGLIGFISQLGYVFSYSISGIMADSLGTLTNQGVGRGSAYIIQIAGICLIITALSIPTIKKIKKLEL